MRSFCRCCTVDGWIFFENEYLKMNWMSWMREEEINAYLVAASALEWPVRSLSRSWRQCETRWPASTSCRCRLARARRRWPRTSARCRSRSAWIAAFRPSSTWLLLMMRLRRCQRSLSCAFASTRSILWLDLSRDLWVAPSKCARYCRSRYEDFQI